jgi:hypothetical protein
MRLLSEHLVSLLFTDILEGRKFCWRVLIVLALDDNCLRSFLVVSRHLCSFGQWFQYALCGNSIRESSEARCYPYNRRWQKDFLTDFVLFEELLDDGYLQEYNSTEGTGIVLILDDSYAGSFLAFDHHICNDSTGGILRSRMWSL